MPAAAVSAVVLAGAASARASATNCESTAHAGGGKDVAAAGEAEIGANPLSAGVPTEMIEQYVQEILQNDDINIKALPDSIERVIYVSTVRLTLNAIYKWLSYLHGISFLGHELELRRLPRTENLETTGMDFSHNSGKIDQECLESMADELLKNQSINQWWIPDAIERQVYVNCLKLVFCLLDKVADTLSIRLCGHELSLSFEPLSREAAKQLIADTQTDLANHKMTVDPDYLRQLVQETVNSSKPTTKFSLFMLLPFYGRFIDSLHTTLFALILGIVDDLLQKTELNVLSERITISLVKSAKAPARKAENQAPEAKVQATAPVDRNLAELPEYQKLLEKVQALTHELETLRAQMQVVAPTAAAEATAGSNGKITTGGEGPNGEREHIKRISAELDEAVKKERIASWTAVWSIVAAISWQPILWGLSSIASYFLSVIPMRFSAG